MPDIQTSAPPPPRAVVFMTTPAAPDLPVDGATPACTLPFGATTFTERVLESCALAGLREIDLVVCDQPERVRALAADGWRWGLTLRWHSVKDALAPYAVLRTLGLAHDERIVIGHGHRWLHEDALRELVSADRVAVQLEDAVTWTGWASMTGLFLHAVSPHAQYAALSEVAVQLHARHCVMVPAGHLAWAGPAPALMQAQQLALRDEDRRHVPATWLHRPWGAMSPRAQVSGQSRIEGPVFIGPGCLVEAGARIEPGTVLSRDVLVASGAVVRDTLVLPDTYISGTVALDQSVVRGNAVHHLGWGARTRLPVRDGVLTPLRPRAWPRTSWPGRLLAAGLALAAAPAGLALGGSALVRRTPWWQSVQAIAGRNGHGQLRTVQVREPRGQGAPAWILGRLGALLDVAQGRRQWLGIRPRDRAQWFALQRDWQALFEGQLPGFFHAPAWLERGPVADGDALAAADAYLVVCSSARERWGLLVALARSCRPAGAAA